MREPRARPRATGAASNGELVTPPSLGVGKKEKGDGVRLSTAASRRNACGAREQSAACRAQRLHVQNRALLLVRPAADLSVPRAAPAL